MTSSQPESSLTRRVSTQYASQWVSGSTHRMQRP
jgi:hypothetical protein